ncbi:40S ribosomal protein S11, N-terminal [Dillenia turbinata]|uniref:40S ribosomal protein S11, N-terminal n=1 Tax=Dillenia turbinata TaxID=194707 RepID=A0AAN8V8Z8_9MAGN
MRETERDLACGLSSLATLERKLGFRCFFAQRNQGGGRNPKTEVIVSGRALNWVFKTPREAIEGTCIDKKCHFGTISTRGRILAGTCLSAKMTRNLIVHLHYVKKKKYRREMGEMIPRDLGTFSHLYPT